MIPDQTLAIAYEKPPMSPKEQTKTYKLDVGAQIEDLTKANELKDSALNEATLEGASNFTDNYYLISILDEIKDMTLETEYTGWTSIRQNENGPAPAYLKSYFQDWDKYADMKTELVSLMVPYFRLSLVTREKGARWSDVSSEVPVILQGRFAGSLDPSAALSEQYNEPTLGLKSFNWRRTAGTGDAGKKAQTVGSMTFFGNNLNIFTKHPYDKLLARTTLGYGLKVVAGWSIAPRALESFQAGGINASVFQNALKQGRKTIYLNTYKNTFDFNQDGTFTVTLDVVGSTEEFMRDFDILGDIENLKRQVAVVNSLDSALRGEQSKKIKGDTKKLDDQVDDAVGADDRISSGGDRSVQQNLEALDEGLEKTLKGSELSDSEKAAFTKEVKSKVEAKLKADYNGDSPTYAGKDELADMVNDLVGTAKMDALKGRTQANMARIQQELYDAGAVRYVKVSQDEFLGFAGQTLTAIKGKKQQLEILLKSVDAEQEFLDRLYGKIEDVDPAETSEVPGLDISIDSVVGAFFFGDDGDDDDKVTFSDPQTKKKISAEDYLTQKGLYFDTSYFTGDHSLNIWDYGDNLTTHAQDVDKAVKVQQDALATMDPNSREAVELRYAIQYSQKRFYGTAYNMAPEGARDFALDRLQNLKSAALQQSTQRKAEIARQLAAMDKPLSDGAPPPPPSIKGKEPREFVGPDPTDPTTKENHYISFFFLGDLINALYSLAAKDNKHNAMPYMMIGSMAYNHNTRQMGIQVQKKEKRTMGQRRMIEMSQIPISIKRFNAFMHKFFVQELVTKVPLSDFLNKVFEVLIRPIFSGEAFDLKLARPRADFLDLDSGEMTMGSYNIMGMVQRTNLSQIDPAILHKPEYNVACRSYMMVTANLIHKANGRGNYHKDRLLSIPHYYMGADRGVIKAVEFAAAPNKFDATDRAIKASSPNNNDLAVLKSPYNVNLTSIGNPLFALGSSFYLLPTIPGKGNASAAMSLGLGGYYRVISLESSITDGGTYETSVFAINEITSLDTSKSNEGSVRCESAYGTALDVVQSAADCPDNTAGTSKKSVEKLSSDIAAEQAKQAEQAREAAAKAEQENKP